MPFFEVTIQSTFGSIGPFSVDVADAETALAAGSEAAAHLLDAETARPLVLRKWVIVVSGADGEVVASLPYSYPPHQHVTGDPGRGLDRH